MERPDGIQTQWHCPAALVGSAAERELSEPARHTPGGSYFALPTTGVTAAFSNSQIAASLGRNLAACPPTGPCTTSVVVSIVPPNTLFEARQNQLDARVTKNFKYGRVRLRANVDVFNLFNINSVLALQTRYGSTFLTPQSILPGRFIKFGTQVDF